MDGGEGMRDFLKRYKIKIETIEPVFIGSGKTINKKEYIRKGKKAYIFDPAKMYKGLVALNKGDAYLNYVLERDIKADLNRWLQEQKVKQDIYKDWTVYEVDGGDIRFDKNPNKEIQTFVKDAYGKPYIPGSSIKGMLRTILLAYEISINEKKLNSVKNEIADNINNRKAGSGRSFLKNETRKLEAEVFNKLERPDQKTADAVNDIMSQIRISDSKPLNAEDLVLCQKVDLNESGKEARMPMLRECIKSGIIAEFELTIDTSLGEGKYITAERIVAAVNRFSGMYHRVFRSKFPGLSQELEKGTVYLGGGAGFVSKTEVYPLFGEGEGVKATSNVLKKFYIGHKHDSDIRRGVSPHICKMTYYGGSLCEMGQCKLTILKLK
ncbi:MAG: type III-A CRISPR-associated RAMP protein Csm5 [Firmicutes bacterium]|nr:type III-A CRISPR-associated RAMP protein Csm5 [Bacillota bacterium]